MRHWDKLLFALGVAMMVFAYGVAVGKYEIFPYEAINDGKDAAKAVIQQYFPDDDPFLEVPRTEAGVSRYDPSAAYDGVTFIVLNQEGMIGALLVDMQGNVLHRWQAAFDQVWPESPHLESRGPNDRFIWHGVHLYPNGNVLFNFEAGGFPAGAGLVMIDKDSKVLWKLARNTHHDVEVGPDGMIYASAHEYNTEGVAACRRLFWPPYLEDVVLVVSPEGELKERIPITEAMCGSPGPRAMLTSQGTYETLYGTPRRSDDPLHLNAVELVTPALASVFPMAAEGDLMVSMRNLNAVAFIDRKSHQVKWYTAGPWLRQHDPRLMPNGHLMVFDNLGGARENGRARMLEFDPVTQQIVWKYEGTPEDPFSSDKGGTDQVLPNGNVLVAESWGGRVFEVTRNAEPPRIVWQYLNVIRKSDKGSLVGVVMAAQRMARGDLTFLPGS